MKKQIFDRPSEFSGNVEFLGEIKSKKLDEINSKIDELKNKIETKVVQDLLSSRVEMQEDRIGLLGKIVTLIKTAAESLSSSAEKAVDRAVEKRASFFMRGKWIGDDIGSPQNPVIDIHTRGQAYGLRLENSHGLPEASGKNIGRVLLNSLDGHVHMDTGSTFKRISHNKFEIDLVNQKGTVELEMATNPARVIWQVKDALDDHKVIHCSIKTIGKKLIIELPEIVSTYRLLGIE